MFLDYTIADRILDNPLELICFSESIEYFDSNKNYSNKPLGNWKGFRSQSLYQLNESLFHKTFNEIFYKVFSNLKLSEFNYVIESFFHILPASYDISNQFHTDTDCMFAGIVYLSENAPESAGTILKFDDEEIEIENYYNRLAMYRSNIVHSAAEGFGETLSNSRKTLNFFVKRLEIKN